jgi:hypothetical protein|eukprot:COSAG02_NODE_4029_length_5885_cov_88.549430_3_plen_61_part_00
MFDLEEVATANLRMNHCFGALRVRADVMLYGVSLSYKESANCRLEAVSFCSQKILLQGVA